MKTSMLWIATALLMALSSGCGGDPYAGQPDHVKERHIRFDGADNFRDLGGYRTQDGRQVRWGLFYRSEHLHDLTDRDLGSLSDLEINLICDFRSPQEKAEEPDRLPESNPPRVAELEIWDPSFTSEGFREKIESGNIEGMDLGEILVEGNRLFATKFSPLYAEMFDLIQDPQNLPVLVHCTAGKDRAGFASALILRVLGVPQETIFEDFLLTNFYTADKIDRAVMITRAATLFQVDEDQLRSVMGVERRYLQSAFDAIQEEYGSFENYRREALGISDAELVAFRNTSLVAVNPD
ncbi:MAG: tyrosine-protein phosphatase [Myxococcota bacterium]|nr:tyrosine-protein phosphatase [Myxococcota bacterium]